MIRVAGVGKGIAGRVRLAFIALLLVVITAACEARVEVEIEVREDGSGIIVVGMGLDPAAMERIPDLEQQLRTSDLSAAGWLIDPPAPDARGVTWVRVSKPFDDAAGANAILDEITGADGPLSTLTLERTDAFAESSWQLTGNLDVTTGVEAFLDESVAELLGGDATGGQLAKIEAELGQPAEEMVDFELLVGLPGAERQTVELDLASGKPQTVNLTSAVRRSQPWLVVGAGAFMVLVAILMAFGTMIRYRRGSGVDSEEFAEGESSPESLGEPGNLEFVLLDAYGVLLDSVDPVDQVLIPFLWEAGCILDDAAIRRLHSEAAAGRITTAKFWEACGLPGPGGAHEEFMMYRFRLRPGARDFVERMRERGVHVVVISNDPRAWGDRLASLCDLGDGLDSWITSEEAGARFPEATALASVAKRLGVDPHHCLVFDDDVTSLDTARSASFGTVLFEPDVHVARSPRHPTVRSFDNLDVAPRERVPGAGHPRTPFLC